MGSRKRPLFRAREARNWSIRAKIISLLLVPLITLVVMWALATAVTLGPGLGLIDAQTALTTVVRPAQTLLIEVQQERRLSIAYLAAGRREAGPLIAQRERSDAAIEAFRQSSSGAEAQDAASANTRQRLADFDTALRTIIALRSDVDRGEVDRSAAMLGYTQIVDAAFPVFGSLIRAADEDLDRQSRAVYEFSRASEWLSQEDAVVNGAIATGTFTATDLSQSVQLIGAQRFRFADALAEMHPDDRAAFLELRESQPFTTLGQLENQLLAAVPGPSPVDASRWQATYTEVSRSLRQFELQAADGIVERAKPVALVIFGRIAVAGLLGLIAVIITIIASTRIARSLIKRLAGLRQAALELAVDRLPSVVTRLRQGEPVDVSHDAPPLPYGDDEIGQVGHAFNELQRTAIRSAVDEANVRRGLNEVFLNIARRSQTLLHRQLSILDRMERRTDDPVELEDLFRVDHLATRMRRHAEDLVILAGAAPGRGWRNPVTIVDVLRGAVSEVEDYARVSIRPMPEIGVVGRAVGDVIHLLAELIENATSFSPPHTRVSVGGEFVAHGFAVEIEDRGLGMPATELAEANRRLADPPDFDPGNSAQLGLFVVARLAARHGIKVQLRSSAYGGITAVALLPEDLVITAGELAARTRQAVAALPAGGRTETALPAGGRTEASRADADNPVSIGADLQRTRGTLYRDPSFDRQVEVDRPTRDVDAKPTRSGRGQSKPAPIQAKATVATPAKKARPRHARSDVIEPPPSATPDTLPRRIRQTNLAPQLRDNPPEGSVNASGDLPTQGTASRSPEQMRAMMTSFQAGMARGRREAGAMGGEHGTVERDAE
ncbi:MAG TPA: nitrate- and nitrite sensing domain-containing protein [Micromonosporaceae bacterium]